MSEQLVNFIAEMQEEEALALVKEQLAAGTPPTQILEDCRVAMEMVGKRFEEGQYFIPELILAGEILKSITDEAKPYMTTQQEAKKGARVLVGGHHRPIVGVVTMDQMMVDCGDDDGQPGDDAVLIGRQGEHTITATDWAESLDTIAYEIVCGVSARVERRPV